MSRNTPQKTTDRYIARYDYPIGNRFEIWTTFFNDAVSLFQRECNDISEKIKKFDEQHSEHAGFDGIEQYLDDVTDNVDCTDKILPLAYIGAFNHFEKYFRTLCSDIKDGNWISLSTAFSGRYVGHCKKYLISNRLITNHQFKELDLLWERVDGYKELRNVLAHNDYENPCRDRIMKLEKIGIKIIEARIQSITNAGILNNSIATYDEFITKLVEKIGKNLA